MSNTLVNTTLVSKEAAFKYVNSLRMGRNVNKKYRKDFAQTGAKVGDSIFLRIPVRFEPTEGQAFQQQNILEQTVPLTVEKQFTRGMGWSSIQGTLSIDEVRERYVNPCATGMANQADVYLFQKVFKDIYNTGGTPGTAPTAPLTYMQAVTQIVNQAGDDSDLRAAIAPNSMAALAAAQSTFFNPTSTLSSNYRSGQQANDSFGIQTWFREPNVQSYVTGSYAASTPLVDGANQTGSSLLTDGWATMALKKGDSFTIGGVYTANPLSYSAADQLQTFVLTADVTDTAGAATLSISPSIITSGPLRTVSNSPANNAVITVRGATSPSAGTMTATRSPQNIVFNRDAITFVNVDALRPMGGVDCSFVQSDEWGISIRLLSNYDMLNDQNPTRLDMFAGAALVNAGHCARIYA